MSEASWLLVPDNPSDELRQKLEALGLQPGDWVADFPNGPTLVRNFQDADEIAAVRAILPLLHFAGGRPRFPRLEE